MQIGARLGKAANDMYSTEWLSEKYQAQANKWLLKPNYRRMHGAVPCIKDEFYLKKPVNQAR